MNPPDPIRRNLYTLLGAFLFLIVAIGAVSYRYYIDQKSGIENEMRSQLEAIAAMKVEQLVAWRDERLADARMIAATEVLPAVRDVLAGRTERNLRRQVLAWMQALRQNEGYANVILVDAEGKVCLSTGPSEGGEGLYAALMDRVRKAGDVVFSDLHYDQGLQGPHLGLNVPIRSMEGRPPDGALLLGIDPNKFLYPLIQGWPTSNGTGETLIVRREGDEVVYLNELRYRKDTALKLRYPLGDRQRPAVRAALGQEGIADGVDYRGVPVLAAVRKVRGSPWVLVAKMDAEEVYAPVRRQTLWLVLMACSLALAAGAVALFVFRDLRARFFQQNYQAELERSALEERFRRVVENAPEGIAIHSEGQLRYLNPAALAMFGAASVQQLADLPLMERIHPDYRALVVARMRLSSDERQSVPAIEEKYLRLDGTVFDVEVSAVPFVHEHKNGSLVFFRDITGRMRSEEAQKRSQQQLQQAQKMESVGRLAGGVAHDFNNLLTVINGYAELTLAQLAPADPLREALSEIASAGNRAADLTRQLLAFSRKQLIEPKPVDLNQVVADVGKMLRRLLGEDIEVVTIPAPSLGHTMVDPGQMHQVLVNLAVNSRDAMPHGGQFVIETGRVDIDDEFVAAHPEAKAGAYVLLAVTDTGTGMDEMTRQYAFEPFFTTKDKSQGTGLGLSMVYGIVKQSGGWIALYSEPGKGTTFKIYLPRTEETEAFADTGPAVFSSLQGTETILVVEDQPEVRKLTVEILKRYGYGVLEAANGDEALMLCQRLPDRIDLMITDVVMPGMTGRELALRMAQVRPATRVLYISGYTANVISQHGVLDPGVAYLSKPFAPEALAGKVREVLAES
ncbi:MAG: response regulator [Acidobacteriia bacterium]|nr:response regulator [Terriglobia bacterium]